MTGRDTTPKKNIKYKRPPDEVKSKDGIVQRTLENKNKEHSVVELHKNTTLLSYRQNQVIIPG